MRVEPHHALRCSAADLPPTTSITTVPDTAAEATTGQCVAFPWSRVMQCGAHSRIGAAHVAVGPQCDGCCQEQDEHPDYTACAHTLAMRALLW